MAHVVYYAACSLDGRIAGPDHDLAFLETLSGETSAGGYDAFFAGVDSLVMGAETWRFIVAHGSWAYGDKPAWIVTHADGLEPLAGARVERFEGDVGELVRRIDARGLERTWLVGGGALAGQFLAADLLDELQIAVAPTFVGRGPALVDGDVPLHRFRLVELDRFAADGVWMRLERARDET